MNEKMVKLLDLVVERTAKNEIPWQDTPDDSAFEAHMGDSSFSIEETREGYRFSAYDSSGRRLEAISTVPIQTFGDPTIQFNEKLSDLFDSARKQALQVDENLDRLIEAMSA